MYLEYLREEPPEVRPDPAKALPEEHALRQQRLKVAAGDAALGQVAAQHGQYPCHLHTTPAQLAHHVDISLVAKVIIRPAQLASQ